MQALEERRLFERFSARFPAKFKDSRDDFGTRVSIRNASADGLRFTTKERLFPKDSIALEVKLPDAHKPMTLRGEVIWTRTDSSNLWDVGLKLHKINLMSMSRMYNLAQA